MPDYIKHPVLEVHTNTNHANNCWPKTILVTVNKELWDCDQLDILSFCNLDSKS